MSAVETQAEDAECLSCPTGTCEVHGCSSCHQVDRCGERCVDDEKEEETL